MNTLYYGDNLDPMHCQVSNDNVNLVYLVTYFNSDINDNVSFQEQKERRQYRSIIACYLVLSFSPVVDGGMTLCLN